MILRMAIEATTLRTTLKPGDLGEIVALHGRLYLEPYALSPMFEADLASGVGRAVEAGWPDRGGVWLAEHEGRLGGSMALTFESEHEARLRWVAVDPELRGRGIARSMLAQAINLSESTGHELLSLDTFSELTTAGRMYREAGFVVVSERDWDRWGRRLTLQRYERRS
jgi:GNAT superfamily N-acetyltransferase